jgi:hypothetical protein
MRSSSRASSAPASVLSRDIELAERAAIRAGLRRCAERFASRSWLPPTSGFIVHPGEYLSSLTPSDLPGATNEIAEFAAASSILHCFDAWTTLGNAIHALFMGHVSEAIHLTYYAELRAALSMMGSTGVVVQKDSAVSIGLSSSRRLRTGSSHEVLWDVFSAWCASSPAQDLVSSSLRFHDVPMSTWVSTARKGGSGLPVISELLNHWGVDLVQFKSDRANRNLASYNPTHLHETRNPNSAQWSRTIATDLVGMLEPKPASAFNNLDNRLLNSIAASIGIADDHNMRRVARSLKGAHDGDFLFDRIQRLRAMRPTVLDAAGQDPSNAGTTSEVVESMLGRALILCRLAAGGALRLRIDAGLDGADLRWWSDELGTGHGMWDPDEPPDNLRDLWNEVGEGLNEVLDVELARPESPFELLILAASGIRASSSLGRVALWSMCA